LLFRLQEVQFFDIVQVERSAGLFLQADQVLDADKRSPNVFPSGRGSDKAWRGAASGGRDVRRRPAAQH
jgi:hypothetical protein